MKVIGHRGAAALAPENTFAGFNLALELGVDGIETDVQRTKDGQLVLFHGATLDKTTNGVGAVQEKTWQELRQLDAGSWFGSAYAGEQIPLLIDLLKRYGTRTYFDLEIKQVGIEEDVLSVVEQLDLLERVTFTAQDFQAALALKQHGPLARVGFITADVSEECITRVVEAGLHTFCPRAEKVTPPLVERWHARGLFVRACGVKDVALMRKAIDAGVDGMTCDFPDILLKELGRS